MKISAALFLKFIHQDLEYFQETDSREFFLN